MKASLFDTLAQPREKAAELAVWSIGFLLGSGGLDADGGIPDSDLAFGIGAHRSIFTHSFLVGAALETAIFAFVDLVRVVHRRLPSSHDPIWDNVMTVSERYGGILRRSLSAGLALHFLADATIQGWTAYKDLPVPAPEEVHRAIMVGSAVAEAGRAVAPDDGHDESLSE